jgi:hypothetical protein
MSDRIIQSIAPIIHAYYQARGKGLEKTCAQVVDKIQSGQESSEALKCGNVFRLTTTGIDVLRFHRNDRLLVAKSGRLDIYEALPLYAYNTPTIKECKWKLIDDGFSTDSVMVDDLLADGATIYLVRVT